MNKIKLISWNVNGLRAVAKKGFLDWLAKAQPDVLCLQETKAYEQQLPLSLKQVNGYQPFFCAAERKGYSGVAIYTRKPPKRVKTGMGISRFDTEGRTLMAEYEKFLLYCVYFPNGKASKERLQYKMDFYDAFLNTVEKQRKAGKKIVICGDVNTAHREIDLARPKENEKVSGFLPEERAWIDALLSSGYVDTFRIFEQNAGHYTWWDLKTRARERNVGWRLDYFFVSRSLKHNVVGAHILDNVQGSDHCPISLELGG